MAFQLARPNWKLGCCTLIARVTLENSLNLSGLVSEPIKWGKQYPSWSTEDEIYKSDMLVLEHRNQINTGFLWSLKETKALRLNKLKASQGVSEQRHQPRSPKSLPFPTAPDGLPGNLNISEDMWKRIRILKSFPASHLEESHIWGLPWGLAMPRSAYVSAESRDFSQWGRAGSGRHPSRGTQGSRGAGPARRARTQGGS